MTDGESGAEIPISSEARPCRNFEEVKTFRDLAEAVFSINEKSLKISYGVNKPIDSKIYGRRENKLELLADETSRYNLDQTWIIDNDGVAHNFGQIVRKFNPEWKEGEFWGGNIPEEERTQIIKESWLRVNRDRAVQLAKELGGKAFQLNSPSMEAGLSTVIILGERKEGDQILYRGLRTQGLQALDSQVSGMLRTGLDSEGRPAGGSVYTERLSTIVQNPEIRQAVYQLAEKPTEKGMREIIGLYKKHNLRVLDENAEIALRSALEKMELQQISFEEAFIRLHISLMEGNVGYSPFVATTTEMGETENFSGSNGMVLLMGIGESRISHLAPVKEKLVKGWVERKEILAVIPIDRQLFKDQKSDWQKTQSEFNKAGKEIEEFMWAPLPVA